MMPAGMKMPTTSGGGLFSKLVGLILLLIGAYMNYAVLSETNLPNARNINFSEQTTLIAIALILEVALNFFQRDMFSKNRADGVTGAALLIDTALKAAFLIPFFVVLIGPGNMAFVVAVLSGGAFAVLTHYAFTH